MATIARQDQQSRKVEVDRIKLIEKLTENKQKHVAEYDAAIKGYKSELLDRLNKSYNEAKKTLKKNFTKIKNQVSNLSEEDIENQNDSLCFIDEIYIHMQKPKSYEKEYDVAIDMMKWDVRDTVELTYAEFTCFINDDWSWKRDFKKLHKMYSSVD